MTVKLIWTSTADVFRRPPCVRSVAFNLKHARTDVDAGGLLLIQAATAVTAMTQTEAMQL